MSAPRSYQLYLHLSAEQRMRFKKFVHSPYYNTRTKLQKLVEHWEDITAAEVEWQAADAALKILGNPKALIPLNNLLSDINRLIEDFLIAETVKGDPEWRVAALARALEELGSTRATKAFLRRQERTQPDDPFALHYVNRLADQHHFSLSRQHDNADLLQSQQQLTIYYLTRQLRSWCELLNRHKVLNIPLDKMALQRFKNMLGLHEELLQHHPGTRLYAAVFEWLEAPERDDWHIQLRPKLFTTLATTDNETAKDVCAYLQNYYVQRVNENHIAYLQELYNLFQFMIANSLILEGGILSQWTYKNIVTVGLRLEQFETTEAFIHTWYPMLPQADRDNAYHYNLTALHYARGDYDKAKRLLARVRFSDPVYYLDGHTILLKIYFEEAEGEALTSLKDTLRIYILRQKNISRLQVQLYNNLFRLTLRLYNLSYTSGHLTKTIWQQKADQLMEEVHRNNRIANKAWLLQQLEMLTNRASG